MRTLLFGLLTLVVLGDPVLAQAKKTKPRELPDIGWEASGKEGAVAAGGAEAVAAGLARLKAGGNAVDSAVATIFAAYYPRLRLVLYALAAAISLGRVYLERHYVSDIVAGAAVGVVVAVLLYRHRQALPGGILLEPSIDHSR